jgi:glycosyltransferase involved in cell wall biosynthesis
MKICWLGYLAKNMSWSIVGQNLCRELIKKGHHVDMFSTNGTNHFPEDLRSNLKGSIEDNVNPEPSLIYSKLDKVYDMQLSYTALKNFENYFRLGSKNRFGIWNYETTVLPAGFASKHVYVDKVLPSSNFSKKIFNDNGIPNDKQVVLPHGVHLDRFQNLGKFPLRTKKKYKILANIAQPHLRKNVPGLLAAFGKAFTKADDVCLVLKISKKSPQPGRDISFNDIYARFKKEYKDHADVEIIDWFIEDIEPLYNACDITITQTLCECFWMPGLESFAANKITIAPRYGGHLDYMNDDNSILIDGKEIRADHRMQYWNANSPYSKCFEPDSNQCAEKLKDVVKNYDDYLNKFSPKMKEILPNYTWSAVTDQLLSLCK